jgi:predicted RND superfamily exporter protein
VVPILPVVAAAFSSLMARPAPRPDRCTETTGQDDSKGMGWFTTDNEKPMTLTTEERKLFDRLDQAVVLGTKAAKVVIEAGRALGTIRDRQLYRDVVSTWEEYLERHGLTRRRADQMVAAAATLDAVAEAVQSKTGTVVPSFDQMTERTARNLVGMDVEDAAEAVIEAAGTTEGLTPKTIKAAASKRKKSKAAKVPRPRRFKVAGATVVIMFNRKSNGSTLDALAAATAMAEADLELQARQSEAA